MFIRSSSSVLPLAGLLFASVRHGLAQTCVSYGIDFVDGGSYFINTNSTDDFTCVSQFSGCNNDVANIILSGPNDLEVYCSDVPLQPDYTSEMSTCPLEKSDMTSGEYEMTIISNNGDGDPIAYQRDFEITAGVQQTVTATPTLQYNYTTTPTVTSTSWSILTSTVVQNNTLTVTVPTATKVKTVTPKPTVVTSTTTLTRTFKTWVRTAIIVTSTTTATCTVPPRPNFPDPTWHRKPRILNSLPTGLSSPPTKREAMFAIRDALRKERREARSPDELEKREVDKRNLAKRSADVPTVTVTETTATSTTTSTITGTTSTVLDLETSSTVVTSTLPPSTVFSGYAVSTTTAPQKTFTKLQVTTSYTWTVGTITASLTKWSTVTPTASVTACKRQGGHFGGGWHPWG
ncbi:hypothetical protein AAFC00_007071 [Neodothiora populina]|uniref:Uncharacterized protein n=1 Tax=Neodothiora populina TaxID=2781224 RepID=A0ABR3PCB4_9PEZI